MGQRHTRALFNSWKDPVRLVQEVGWTPGPVWTGAENLVPTGIRSPERPARSQSLYRLSYPAHVAELAVHKSPVTDCRGDHVLMSCGLIFVGSQHLPCCMSLVWRLEF